MKSMDGNSRDMRTLKVVILMLPVVVFSAARCIVLLQEKIPVISCCLGCYVHCLGFRMLAVKKLLYV